MYLLCNRIYECSPVIHQAEYFVIQVNMNMNNIDLSNIRICDITHVSSLGTGH